MLLRKIGFAFLFIALLGGCAKKEECTYNTCSNAAPASEIQQVKDYLASINVTNAQQHCSGVFYVVSNAGSGDAPTPCSEVNAAYVGKLTSGATFDQSTSADFGLAQVITGWRNTIPLLKTGGKITLYIPPSLGYGATGITNSTTGQVVIPGNAILIFEVTLRAIY